MLTDGYFNVCKPAHETVINCLERCKKHNYPYKFEQLIKWVAGFQIQILSWNPVTYYR